MAYAKKDFSKLKGMPGFSEKALDIHFALYEGYVNNVNKIGGEVGKMHAEKKTDSPEFAELRRRFGWEFSGMRLHEVYFDTLGGDGKVDEDGELYKSIVENYGSFENWKKDFVAVGKMRGIGWAALYQDTVDGVLMNFWIDEHDTGHLPGGKLILIMDVFEHAFFPDYGKDKAAYVDAFFENIDWQAVEKRIK